MKCSQANFIRLLRKKEEKALDFVVDQYLPLVKTVVTKVLMPIGKTNLIDECINDIFFALWENIDKFRSEDELDFKKWVYKVAKFKAIDYYRKEMRQPEVVEVEEELVVSLSAEEEMLINERTEELTRLINTLEPVDRNIFTMKYFMGMKTKEISEKLGLTTTAIDNRVYRGKRRLESKTNLAHLEVV